MVLVDFLRQLVALGYRQRGAHLVVAVDFDYLVRRLHAPFAVSVKPLFPQRRNQPVAERRLGVRLREGEAGGVHRMVVDHPLIRLPFLPDVAARPDSHGRLDPDVLPVGDYLLGGVRPVGVALEHDYRQRHALAVRHEAEALGVLNVQADGIQQVFRHLRVELRPERIVLRPGMMRMPRRWHVVSRRRHAQERHFVDCVAVDRHREGAAEIDVLEVLDFGPLPSLVEPQHHVGAAVFGPELDAVAAPVAVFLKRGVGSELDVASLRVQLAGDGAELNHLAVLRQVVNEPVYVRQLIAGGVDRPEVRVALGDNSRVAPLALHHERV